VVDSPTSDAANYYRFYRENAGGAYAGGRKCTSVNSGVAWSGDTKDYAFKVYRMAHVSAAMASGSHVVKVTADGTTMKLWIDGVDSSSFTLNGATTADTVNNWTFMTSGFMPYANYIKITVGGVLVLHYQPTAIIATTVLPDLAGAVQNGAFTFGTNPAGITVTLGALTVPSTVTGGVSDNPDAAGDINQPTGFYGENTLPGTAFDNLIVTLAGVANTPVNLAWWWMYGLCLIVAFAFVYRAFQHLWMAGFAGCVVTGAFVGLGSATTTGDGVIPFWLIIIFVVLTLGAGAAERTQSI
jgi:hypothetical protein